MTNHQFFKQVCDLLARVHVNVLGCQLTFALHRDKCDPRPEARIYIQVVYEPSSTTCGKGTSWRGRKWYLSEHMLMDEVVKTAYLAIRTAVEHEVMEGFLISGHRVFDPHTPYDVLMDAGMREVKREDGAPEPVLAMEDRGELDNDMS
jgi:hypothetical protein